MIIYRKYTQEKTNGNTMKERTRTTLEAKFRFKSETAPINREDIKNRTNKKGPLSDYLKDFEKLPYDEFTGTYHTLTRQGYIIRRFRGLGINIKVVSEKNLKPEEMLNLESLNTFILTGKYPEK